MIITSSRAFRIAGLKAFAETRTRAMTTTT
jgi:hypothetical protein